MLTNKSPLSQYKYVCEGCDYKCSKKSDYDKHLLTNKHITTYKYLPGDIQKSPKTFTCECNKEYKFRQSLYTHRKICQKNTNENIKITINEMGDSENTNNKNENITQDASCNEIKMLKNLVIEIVKSNLEVVKSNNELQQQNFEMQKQNSELQKQMLEVVCKNIQQQPPTNINNNNNIVNSTTNNTINANTTNSNNKTFNLNFFLNEQCKNAMNLKDFVDSMEVTLEDAEKIGEEGYVEGMSSLVIKKINETDVFLRPIHCSDSKRDILHIKRNDKWERDGPNKEHLTMAIKYIEQKNMVALDQMGEKYPDWKDIDSPHNDKYMNMILKLTDSGPEEYKKVVKKIIKEVVIDKENI